MLCYFIIHHVENFTEVHVRCYSTFLLNTVENKHFPYFSSNFPLCVLQSALNIKSELHVSFNQSTSDFLKLKRPSRKAVRSQNRRFSCAYGENLFQNKTIIL